jgi:hypothetical protein
MLRHRDDQGRNVHQLQDMSIVRAPHRIICKGFEVQKFRNLHSPTIGPITKPSILIPVASPMRAIASSENPQSLM